MRPTLGAAQSGYFSNPPANNSSDSLSLLEAPLFHRSASRLRTPTSLHPKHPPRCAVGSLVTVSITAIGSTLTFHCPPKSLGHGARDEETAFEPLKRHSIAGSSYVEQSPKLDPKKLSVGMFSPFNVSLPPEAMASPMAIPPPLPEKPSRPFMFIDPFPIDSINSPTDTEGSLPLEQANLLSEIQSILSSSTPVGPEQVFRLPNIPSAPSLSLMLPQLSAGQSSMESPTSHASLLANPPTPSVHGSEFAPAPEDSMAGKSAAREDVPPASPSQIFGFFCCQRPCWRQSVALEVQSGCQGSESKEGEQLKVQIEARRERDQTSSRGRGHVLKTWYPRVAKKRVWGLQGA